MNSIAWQGPWLRAMNTCITCSSVFWMTEERSMWIMNCFAHRLQRFLSFNLPIGITTEQKKVFADPEPVTVIPGWPKASAPAEHRAPGRHRILQKREVFAADANSDLALVQVPEQAQVNPDTVQDIRQLGQVQDPENHNHHQWLNIRPSAQRKALLRLVEKIADCAVTI